MGRPTVHHHRRVGKERHTGPVKPDSANQLSTNAPRRAKVASNPAINHKQSLGADNARKQASLTETSPCTMDMPTFAEAPAQACNLEFPKWLPEPQPVEPFVRHCHTQKCLDFQSGHCQLHKPMQCFNFHFEGQRRRPPIGADGRLRYWDTACTWISHPAKCPHGDGCQFAHSKDEISYHPAKYKTRACNGRDCRKAICCFAHDDRELRVMAPRRYSQTALAAATGQAALPKAGTLSDEASLFDLQTFKVFPCRKGRGTPHDRKLCIFYHNPRDRRRLPGSYAADPCEECFDAEAQQVGRCSKGDQCPKCHNRLELLYHSEVFKQRFCATFPDVAACQRGSFCAFAHSREEIGDRLLLSEQEEAEAVKGASGEFYMQRFKTLWCPYGVQHDWHQCIYAHTYQDWRRTPQLGYDSEPCPFWVRNAALSDYQERCPNSFRCAYAHGSKEQLYHPLYYKTMPCTDWTTTSQCPRGTLCAFFHSACERRTTLPPPKKDADVSGGAPLLDASALDALQPGFRRPPLFTFEGGELVCGKILPPLDDNERADALPPVVSKHGIPPGRLEPLALVPSSPVPPVPPPPLPFSAVLPEPPAPPLTHPQGLRGSRARQRESRRMGRRAAAASAEQLPPNFPLLSGTPLDHMDGEVSQRVEPEAAFGKRCYPISSTSPSTSLNSCLPGFLNPLAVSSEVVANVGSNVGVKNDSLHDTKPSSPALSLPSCSEAMTTSSSMRDPLSMGSVRSSSYTSLSTLEAFSPATIISLPQLPSPSSSFPSAQDEGSFFAFQIFSTDKATPCVNSCVDPVWIGSNLDLGTSPSRGPAYVKCLDKVASGVTRSTMIQ